MSDAIRTTLEQALSSNDDLYIVRETFEGIGGSSTGLETSFGENRVLTLPIADRAAVGTAIGMAIAGKTVVVELSSTGRLPAIVEALTDASSISHNTEFQIGLVVRVPYGGHAGDHIDRAAGDLLAAIPGLQVVCPSTLQAASDLLTNAISANKPIVILEPRELYHRRGNTSSNTIGLNKAIVRRNGQHATIATWGSAVQLSLNAADGLARQGIEVEVIDLVSLSPIDENCLSDSIETTGRLVVVPPEEDPLSRRILQVGLDRAFLYLESPLCHATANHQAVTDAVLQSVYY